jgi:hypothetical protein
MSEQTPSPSEDQLGLLRAELTGLIADAHATAKRVGRWAFFWQNADVGLGLAAAVLAAVAGATGLASTAGRIPAAILALAAAASTAAAKFLRSNERYEIDWTKARAWQALYQSSSAASKAEDSHDVRRLYAIIRAVLACRMAIMEIGHESIPEKAILKLPIDDGIRDESVRRDQSSP